MRERAPNESFTITPSGKALKDAIRSAADGRILLVRVAATSHDFFFQFTSETLAAADPSVPDATALLTRRDVLDRVLGPYCTGCRKAATAVDFTDWTTSERRDEIVPGACRNCGRAFSSAGQSTEEMRRAALEALMRAAR